MCIRKKSYNRYINLNPCHPSMNKASVEDDNYVWGPKIQEGDFDKELSRKHVERIRALRRGASFPGKRNDTFQHIRVSRKKTCPAQIG